MIGERWASLALELFEAFLKRVDGKQFYLELREIFQSKWSIYISSDCRGWRVGQFSLVHEFVQGGYLALDPCCHRLIVEIDL